MLGGAAHVRHEHLNFAYGIRQAVARRTRIVERGLERAYILVAEYFVEMIGEFHQPSMGALESISAIT